MDNNNFELLQTGGLVKSNIVSLKFVYETLDGGNFRWW